VIARPVAEAGLDGGVGEFLDLTAFLADREGDAAVAVAMRVGAGDEGVDRFKPVDEPVVEKLLERAIDLQGRAEASAPSTISWFLVRSCAVIAGLPPDAG
jgi:hypothetical protein